ncbi:MAG TPA: hypothetical protein VNA20_18750 [Frankiaceae bacterium]|nr:hypothetical protein [Frankiaceae bacterium]
MRRTVAVVAALALAAGPAVAATDPSTPARRWAAIAELRERLARRLPGLRPEFAKAAAPGFFSAALISTPDLDGDRGDEVIDLRVTGSQAADGSYTETTAFHVHRGRDGKRLWSRTLSGTGFAFPLPARVGAQGRPGVIVVSYDFELTNAAAAVGVSRTVVTAYDARGKAVWSFSSDGTGVGGPVSGGGGATTYVVGLIDAVPGGPDEVLVSTIVSERQRATQAAYANVGTVVPAILDGTTGQARRLTPVAATSDAFATPIGDIDGDRAEDVVVTGGAGPAESFALAQSSADGRVLWSARELPPAEAVYPKVVPDATGDGVADVLVETSDDAAAPLAVKQDPYVTLLDGRTGAQRWRRVGAAGYSLGDADRRRGAEVAVAEAIVNNERLGVRLAAYDAAGRRIWVTTRTVAFDLSRVRFAVLGVTPSGDTDGDRVNELLYSIQVTGSAALSAVGVVDGRTGRTRSAGAAGLAPAGAIDGRGADAVGVEAGYGSFAVTAWRGSTGRKLWTVWFATYWLATSGIETAYADRDRCADVLAGVASHDVATATHYVLSGATGRPLWALTRTKLGAARISRPKPLAHQRFARTC